MSNLLFSSAKTGSGYKETMRLKAGVGILTIILFVCLVAVFILGLKNKRRKKRLMELSSQEEVLYNDNIFHWKKKYEKLVLPENCESYAVVYINPGVDILSRVFESGEDIVVMKKVSKVIRDSINREFEAYARFNKFYYIILIKYTGTDALKQRLSEIHNQIREQLKEENLPDTQQLYSGIFCIRWKDREDVKAIHYAEIAMQYAKTNMKEYAFYRTDVEMELINEYTLEKEVVQGVQNKEFVLCLQPFVEAETMNVCGAEALVRWNHPIRGLLKPEQFLAILKKKKLLAKMNLDVFRQGCDLLYKENQKGHKLWIMFNFSADNFSDPQFSDQLQKIVQEFNLECSQIVLQINEMMEAGGLNVHHTTLEKLRKAGFHLCMSGLELDKGFLEYAKAGVDGIKLKYQLIRQTKTEEGKKVIRMIVELCQAFHICLYCVGVEEVEQKRFLQELGCNVLSGFLFYYPMDVKGFEEIMNGFN